MSKPSVLNPDIVNYFKFKGRLNTYAFLDMIDAIPHSGQRKIIDAYEKKIPASESTIKRGEDLGVPLDWEYAYTTLVISAGRRTGKSVTAGWFGAMELMIPNSHVMICSIALSNCETIFKHVRSIMMQLGIELEIDRQKDMLIQTKSGSRLTVSSLENSETRLGQAVSLLIVDEAAMFNKTLFEQVLLPMTSDRAPLSRAVLISSPRPGWYADYHLRGESDLPKFAKYFSITLPTSCNPNIPPKFLEEMEATMPPELFAQEYLGQFSSTAGLVFTEFKKERNVKSADDYPHLWSWIQNGNVVINSIDSGFSHYFASIWAVYVEEIDTIIIFHEYTKNRTVTPEHARYINEYECENGIYVDIRYADPAAAQQIADLAEYDLCYNSAEKGLVDTIQSVNTMFFQRSEITGEPKLIILDNCTESIRQLSQISWKEDGQHKTTQEKSRGLKPFLPDTMVRGSDFDLVDAIRYFVNSFTRNMGVTVSVMDFEGELEEFDQFTRDMNSMGYFKC